MNKESKIYVAGHKGMVGSAIVRKLEAEGYTNLVLRNSKELDLRNQQAVDTFFATEKPEYVFLAAAKVGGIQANNTYRADFIYENLMIEANVIHAAYQHKVQKLLFLGSSCIYPKLAPQPLKEESLLSGYLEPTNQPYAIAKIAGIELCDAYRRQYGCDFISAMPTNLYGPNDNYDLEKSHVLPALLRKFMTAVENGDESVTVWGRGTPLREFLHVDDMAAACLFLMQKVSATSMPANELAMWNVGLGSDISIADLAQLIGTITGFQGTIHFDATKPDGTPRKLMDVSKLKALGWQASISLEDGIRQVYNDLMINRPW
ncbi:MAG: GDP-L-fucose synthase [Sediminibacterium sp. Gen4]|jgi:GDP-L-fucose synthase|uniref:GDP-L-fucose synthase n=1 Tax=unclassified Sediminibacterium TaxID=2635961 RepID=UPI0015BC794A|nr:MULTISPECIES: GDP-L-fucose synthase [unclassified Sediminibacterium]MBW0162559.1 GDP-L-fucose synthase [Sediminibacterium sp.]MBW0163738.1 GDP-L-fucose synthase [Sediminibacterium sp.]NWK66912.1 GDP-L-fucose synthase [Sediminibacterium sp. Gen4]